MARVVLVTGVSRYLGGRLARLAADKTPTVDRVIGVDVIPPGADIGSAEFVRADIRNPVIAKVIKAADDRHRRAHERHRDPVRCRRAVGDERDQRHRHDAAARGLPAIPDASSSWS